MFLVSLDVTGASRLGLVPKAAVAAFQWVPSTGHTRAVRLLMLAFGFGRLYLQQCNFLSLHVPVDFQCVEWVLLFIAVCITQCSSTCAPAPYRAFRRDSSTLILTTLHI